MRTHIFWRISALLLLLSGGLALSIGDLAPVAVVAQDDDDKGNNGNGNQGNNGNKGNNGNDDNDDDDGDAGKENGNGKARGNERKREQGEAVSATLPYTVEVTCEPAADSTRTTCTFTGIAPEGGKDVGHVDLPESEVCAEVVGGDYEYVDPDPNTRVTGYKSRGSEGVFTLMLDGTVTTGGEITYWIKSGGGVFPAAGPGLICGEPAMAQAAEPTGVPTESAAPTPGTTPTEPAAPTPTGAAADVTFEPTDVTNASTGGVLVVAYLCPEKPADPATYDWFGLCAPDGSPREFSLALVDTPDAAATLTTAETGEATFGDLAPGTYVLKQSTGTWCNAKSDNVTPEGNVVVEAGQRTTVWAFHCPEEAPK